MNGIFMAASWQDILITAVNAAASGCLFALLVYFLCRKKKI